MLRTSPLKLLRGHGYISTLPSQIFFQLCFIKSKGIITIFFLDRLRETTWGLWYQELNYLGYYFVNLLHFISVPEGFHILKENPAIIAFLEEMSHWDN